MGDDAQPHYARPGWFTQHVFNPTVALLTRAGISVWGSRELRVRGRTTGKQRGVVINLRMDLEVDLPPMMGLVRKHVGEHRRSGRPRPQPSPRKFRYFAVRSGGQGIDKHSETLLCALSVGERCLLHRAAIGIQWSRAPEVRGIVPQPDETAVVQVREDGGDGPVALRSGQLFAPGLRV